MAETRSSSSFTASLKDYVLDDFELCKLSVTKTCGEGVWNDSEGKFEFPVTITVKNDGFGDMYKIYGIDDRGTPNDTSDDVTLSTLSVLAKGGEYTYPTSETNFKATVAPTNTVQIYAASTPAGTAIFRAEDDATCSAPDLQPAMDVSKNCDTLVYSEGGKLVLKVNFDGEVCNTSGDLNNNGLIDVIRDPVTNEITYKEVTGISLKNVAAIESIGSTALTLSKTTLPPYDPTEVVVPGIPRSNCATFSGNYYPDSADAVSGLPGNASVFTFSDTVSAVGYSLLNKKVEDTSAPAYCPLCDCTNCK